MIANYDVISKKYGFLVVTNEIRTIEKRRMHRVSITVRRRYGSKITDCLNFTLITVTWKNNAMHIRVFDGADFIGRN